MAASLSGVRPGLDGRLEVNIGGDTRSADTDRDPDGNWDGRVGHANRGATLPDTRTPTRIPITYAAISASVPQIRLASRRCGSILPAGYHQPFSRHMDFIMLSPRATMRHVSRPIARNALISDQRVWDPGVSL